MTWLIKFYHIHRAISPHLEKSSKNITRIPLTYFLNWTYNFLLTHKDKATRTWSCQVWTAIDWCKDEEARWYRYQCYLWRHMASIMIMTGPVRPQTPYSSSHETKHQPLINITSSSFKLNLLCHQNCDAITGTGAGRVKVFISTVDDKHKTGYDHIHIILSLPSLSTS